MVKKMAKLKVLQQGYFRWEEEKLNADSSVVLVVSDDKRILVDTGGRTSLEKIITGLSKEGLKPSDIDLIISTHNHPDHVWNNYAFGNATVFEASVLYKPDGTFEPAPDFQPAQDVSLLKTPGHTPEDYTVLVETEEGIYALTGDVIMNENLLNEGDASFSYAPDVQKESQRLIFKNADFIIPGHGPMFKTNKYKTKD